MKSRFGRARASSGISGEEGAVWCRVILEERALVAMLVAAETREGASISVACILREVGGWERGQWGEVKRRA